MAKTIDHSKTKREETVAGNGAVGQELSLFEAFDPLNGAQFQVMDHTGAIVSPQWMPQLSDERMVEGYRLMLTARAVDLRLVSYQRQGRIFTLPPCMGQEAAAAGSAFALEHRDWMVPAFRELAAMLHKGATIKSIFTYYSGSEFGSVFPEDAHLMPITVPISSQLPHAVGIGYAIKYRGGDDVVMAYFGDGGTSQGDFNESLNFAAVFSCPVIFFCNNNQYAISVPRTHQTKSKTIAQKAIAYGMPGIQVDGNDFLAVYRATEEAVKRGRAGEGPTLIEAYTYRRGAHTTSDDPTKYRTKEEEDYWAPRDPLLRFRTYLESRGLWNEDLEKAHMEKIVQEVDVAFKEVENMPLPDADHIFAHVFEQMPDSLKQQKVALENFLKWKEGH
jgi:pyruvate dehydrogenase E1 component alpha subunit